MSEAARDRARQQAARRQKEWRTRQALGRTVLRVEVDPHLIAEALIDAGCLAPAESADPVRLAEALASLLACWAEEVALRVTGPPAAGARKIAP